ncbi:TraB/GumN family protein [Endozoicomonas sp. OPT23]|uniref:TraB/GumN family protein n=1 Tax=Endozoicomonas sp. OPT23 TaxID=2072845 RepID=UPI0018912063|nr:TraB/GumN family protein [Endozoicomonas sp. OPT23]
MSIETSTAEPSIPLNHRLWKITSQGEVRGYLMGTIHYPILVEDLLLKFSAIRGVLNDVTDIAFEWEERAVNSDINPSHKKSVSDFEKHCETGIKHLLTEHELRKAVDVIQSLQTDASVRDIECMHPFDYEFEYYTLRNSRKRAVEESLKKELELIKQRYLLLGSQIGLNIVNLEPYRQEHNQCVKKHAALLLSLDDNLFNYAKNNNKQIHALSPFQEFYDLINNLSHETQRKSMIDVIESEEDIDFSDTRACYLMGDDCDLMTQTRFYLNDDEILIDDNNDAWSNEMLPVRSRNWLPKIGKLLESKEKKTLFAVGTAHLYGKYGLVYLLREKGYEVEPIPLQVSLFSKLHDNAGVIALTAAIALPLIYSSYIRTTAHK